MDVVLGLLGGLSVVDVMLRLIAGLVVGFAVGMTGVGGGVLVMPILTGLFGLGPNLAVPTANFLAVLVKSHAVYEHLKLKNVRRRAALWLVAGGLPVAIATSMTVKLGILWQWWTKAGIDESLKYLIVAVMSITLIIVIINFVKDAKKSDTSFARSGDPFGTSMKLQGIGFGALIGFLIASTSVGGGVLVIPILATFFNLSPRNTVGTSVAISIVLALTSSAMYFGFSAAAGADVPYLTCLLTAVGMFVGALPGVYVGSRWAVKMPGMMLKTIIVLLIVAAIGGMLLDGGGGH